MKILVLNCGSSSLKYQLLDMSTERVIAKGNFERIGEKESFLTHKMNGEKYVYNEVAMNHEEALNLIMKELQNPDHRAIENLSEINAIGHRVVAGGEIFDKSVIIDEKTLKGIEACSKLAPLHNPAAILGIKACQKAMPGVPMVAAFDTAFHQTMPKENYLYPIPYEYYEKYGIRKYGAHGTSHKYVTQRVEKLMNKDIKALKIVTCHLGQGASLCAVQGGKSVDTSMGLTPLGGITMVTRSGDLDPSVVTAIMKKENLTADEVESILNKKSGLTAVSKLVPDFREIENASTEGNEDAIIAINKFVSIIAQYIARYAAVMEGIDAEVVCCITDSSGNILKSSRALWMRGNDMLKTRLYPTNCKRTENLQAFIVNPYWVIFQKMTLLLIATVIMMILIIGCIVYQIRIIARQNKIAKIREDFSYALIHDMKTPISSILMGIQILETGKLDTRPEKRAKLFHILKDESEHLLALTEKVLTLSKLENHQLNLFREMLSLRSMLDDLIEKFSAKADKPVHFSLALEAETVVADGEFLKEAISNLIDNAIKYSGASVAIIISSFCKPDGAVVIKVKDNGFGIPLKDQSRIFEKYERASATERSRKGGASGFGLGLNYVFRVAEAHGGTVEVESIEGEYSEFSLSLPQKEFLDSVEEK